MKPLPTAHVPLPELVFDDRGQPFSAQFNDVYFSKAGGEAETRHVFLAGNNLPARFADRPRFTIGEFGFGTGLNFLGAWREFLAHSQAPQHLHVISVEKYPLTREMLAKIYLDGDAQVPSFPESHRDSRGIQSKEKLDSPRIFPRENSGNDELLRAYPLRLPGWHRVELERCTLTLGFGDAAELFSSIDAAVDAWFIDGFSPAKNPDMWQEAALAQLARLSAPDATFATFTAAGAVKRQLQALGFEVQKVKGFGHKREMLVGRHTLRHCEASLGRGTRNEVERGEANPSSVQNEDGLARRPALASGDGTTPRNDGVRGNSKGITIIGAGIAGASLAWALAERGYKVMVLERGTVAGGASGNPAGVLYPQLTKFYTPATAWHFTAYGFMLQQLARWKSQGMAFASAQPGMLRLPRPDQRASDFASLQMDESIMCYVTREEASALAGVDVVSDGWWFPHGTWLAPAELCRALLQHENITLHENCAVTALHNVGDGWRVELATGSVIARASARSNPSFFTESEDGLLRFARNDASPVLKATTVCIAAAQEAPRLLPEVHLPMGISAGQISLLPADAVAGDVRCIISHRGYIIPQQSTYLLGATYDRTDLSGAVTEKNHEENLQHAREALPHWLQHTPPMQGRTSFRATTPDRLPYVGQVAEGLYVSVGHGSRGMISAPLAAEIIASQIAGEMVPLARDLLAAIHPLRRQRTTT